MPARARDLSANPDLIDRTAQLLFDAFRDHAAAWPTIESARDEVLESLAGDRVSRVIVGSSGEILGWIGAIPIYDGHVWEVHPLVVASAHRRIGIGRALIADLEQLAVANGVLTLWAGSDDEHNETTIGGVDLYEDIPAAMRNIRNLRGHPFEFYLRVGFRIAGVLPDANGRGKPDIFLAKRVGA
jgi:aminoglycoside 6'-N-acetyltransferase I